MLILAFEVCHTLPLNAFFTLYNLFLKHVTSTSNRLFYHCRQIQQVLFFLFLGLQVCVFILTRIHLNQDFLSVYCLVVGSVLVILVLQGISAFTVF